MYSKRTAVVRTRVFQRSYRTSLFDLVPLVPSTVVVTANKEIKQVLAKARNLLTYKQCANCTKDMNCDDLKCIGTRR